MSWTLTTNTSFSENGRLIADWSFAIIYIYMSSTQQISLLSAWNCLLWFKVLIFFFIILHAWRDLDSLGCPSECVLNIFTACYMIYVYIIYIYRITAIFTRKIGPFAAVPLKNIELPRMHRNPFPLSGITNALCRDWSGSWWQVSQKPSVQWQNLGVFFLLVVSLYCVKYWSISDGRYLVSMILV